LCGILGIQFGGCQTAFLSRETTHARDAGTKNPATTHEGVKAGKSTLRKPARLFPIQSLARLLAADYRSADLMSVNEQVFWLLAFEEVESF
jgi:hypothetical protein